ncbi:Trafficking protein particle complex subunit 2-like protein [Geodia barretti]|uniref:Trafficking protein particle complex subunit 2-like protein n=1 Tax=Geodia barretti TaxID=519541 RepID=A0AA35RND4_GEOBA|nr:Trafficking protein particle complex subunit 2-like protein [Geodia barretti]
MAAVCVAVISKQNFPLYLRSVNPQNEADLQFQYLVHASIDVVEEKVSTLGTPKAGQDPREHYLGLLYPSEQYKVYGYATNTRVKFILVVENTTSQSRDTEMKMLFKNLHVAYADMLCNPFYTPGQKITSRTFNNAVSSIFQMSKGFTSKE